jgi:putative tricarboxylic transport membrane protein
MLVRDRVAALIIFLFGAAVFTIAGDFLPAAALFPRAVAVIMMVSAIVIGLRASISKRPTGEAEFDREATIRIGAVIVLTILYVAGVRFLGYVTASVIFIPVTAWFLGVRKPVLLAATTVIFIGVIAYLFREVFSIPLPREAILTLLS